MSVVKFVKYGRNCKNRTIKRRPTRNIISQFDGEIHAVAIATCATGFVIIEFNMPLFEVWSGVVGFENSDPKKDCFGTGSEDTAGDAGFENSEARNDGFASL